LNKKIKEQIGQIGCSAGIGVMVANIILLLSLTRYIGVRSVVNSFIISAIIGVVIGFIAKESFNYIANKFSKDIIWAYIIEGVLVFILTIGVTYALGQRKLIYLLLCGVVALILAMVYTSIKVKKFRELNEKLREFQKK